MPHSENGISTQNVPNFSIALAKAFRLLARPFFRLWEIVSAPRIVAAEVLLDDRVVYRSPRGM